MVEQLTSIIGNDNLFFYDASAPLIDSSSIDLKIAYKKSRYDKGGADYLNCPFNKEEFLNFYNELINAESFKLKDFEK